MLLDLAAKVDAIGRERADDARLQNNFRAEISSKLAAIADMLAHLHDSSAGPS